LSRATGCCNMRSSNGLDFVRLRNDSRGKTIAGLLENALAAGLEFRIWYGAVSAAQIFTIAMAALVARGGTRFPIATFCAGIKIVNGTSFHAARS